MVEMVITSYICKIYALICNKKIFKKNDFSFSKAVFIQTKVSYPGL